jgi:hypothetical protein
MGVSERKEIGEWFGPNTVAQVLKKLVVYDEWSRLAVHVALDNLLIDADVREMATTTPPTRTSLGRAEARCSTSSSLDECQRSGEFRREIKVFFNFKYFKHLLKFLFAL